MAGNQKQAPQQQQFNPQQLVDKINEHAKALEQAMLINNQQQQILDQYRMSIYNLELRVNLLNKILEEKGVMVKEEFNQRWPIYLKNDIGAIGPSGRMENGELKITMYNGDK